MGTVSAVIFLTLDGVMQAPGRPDEDPRDGFTHGGWAQPYNDPVMGQKMAEGMASESALLFGRRTYEDFAAFWPKQTDNPFTGVLDASHKYVASRTLREPLPWQNSTLLPGDAADGVARLREESAEELTILGGGEFVRSLIRRDLIDEYLLLIHPLILGTGRRLFPDGAMQALRLVDSVTTTTGVVMATYRPENRPVA